MQRARDTRQRGLPTIPRASAGGAIVRQVVRAQRNVDDRVHTTENQRMQCRDQSAGTRPVVLVNVDGPVVTRPGNDTGDYSERIGQAVLRAGLNKLKQKR
jgi:hypothetical protein